MMMHSSRNSFFITLSSLVQTLSLFSPFVRPRRIFSSFFFLLSSSRLFMNPQTKRNKREVVCNEWEKSLPESIKRGENLILCFMCYVKCHNMLCSASPTRLRVRLAGKAVNKVPKLRDRWENNWTESGVAKSISMEQQNLFNLELQSAFNGGLPDGRNRLEGVWMSFTRASHSR